MSIIFQIHLFRFDIYHESFIITFFLLFCLTRLSDYDSLIITSSFSKSLSIFRFHEEFTFHIGKNLSMQKKSQPFMKRCTKPRGEKVLTRILNLQQLKNKLSKKHWLNIFKFGYSEAHKMRIAILFYSSWFFYSALFEWWIQTEMLSRGNLKLLFFSDNYFKVFYFFCSCMLTVFFFDVCVLSQESAGVYKHATTHRSFYIRVQVQAPLDDIYRVWYGDIFFSVSMFNGVFLRSLSAKRTSKWIESFYMEVDYVHTCRCCYYRLTHCI